MAERAAGSRFVRAESATATIPDDRAGLRARVLAYFIDSIVLAAFLAAFLALSGANIFLQTDGGGVGAPDSAIWVSVAIIFAVLPAWFGFNLLLAWRRGQTVGHYVVGLSIDREDGGAPGLKQLFLYFLALHPGIFHPLNLIPWSLYAYVSLSLAGREALIIASLAAGLLCVVAPLVAFIAVATDSGRRGLHDRVAGLVVSRLA